MRKILTFILVLAAVLSVSGIALADEAVTINIADGPVTVEAADEAGNVVYKQNGAEVCIVGEATPVTITGSYNVTGVNAIKITKCSPTIVMKDLSISATATNAVSNILIDGEATDDVKFILSGANNKLTRGSGSKSSNPIRMHCAIQIKNATLTFDCQCENGDCKDVSCTDKLTVDAANGYGAVIGAKSGENVGFALNFNGGYVSVDVDYGANRDGAIIGAPFHSSVQFTNTIAINVNDGYLSVIADESAPALGAARARCDLSKISVAINGGVVKTATVDATKNPVASIYAGSLEITNGADVTVEGNIVANTVEVTDAKLVLEPKKSTNTSNPGGSILSSEVIVSGDASLTTAGGINGNLMIEDGAEVEIKGNAASSTSAAPSEDVGGVSGNVTVGAGSTVSVAEDVRGDATVEKGGTLSVGAVLGKLDAAAGSFVNGTTVSHEIIEGANGIFDGQADGLTFKSNADFDFDFESVKVDGKVVDAKNYTAKKGSTVVTLKAEYLKTLTVGEHTLEIVSKNNGTAATKFTIAQGAGVPVYTGGSSYSGPSIWYIGGNSFGTSTTQMPTSVEIDYVSVPFTMEGSNIVVSCIDPGAKWVTVRWNSTSATINFNPDVNVVCAEVAIPKTGDMPIWAAVAEFLGF